MQLQAKANVARPSHTTWDSQLLAAGSRCSRLTVCFTGSSKKALPEPPLVGLNSCR